MLLIHYNSSQRTRQSYPPGGGLREQGGGGRRGIPINFGQVCALNWVKQFRHPIKGSHREHNANMGENDTVLRIENLKNQTRSHGTYLYSPYMRVFPYMFIEFWMHSGSLQSTQETTVALGYRLEQQAISDILKVQRGFEAWVNKTKEINYSSLKLVVILFVLFPGVSELSQKFDISKMVYS